MSCLRYSTAPSNVKALHKAAGNYFKHLRLDPRVLREHGNRHMHSARLGSLHFEPQVVAKAITVRVEVNVDSAETIIEGVAIFVIQLHEGKRERVGR